MTAHFTIDPEQRRVSIAHDPVCARCGHGESLHALSAAGCLLCDQRVSAGLSSSYCNAYLADRLERGRVGASPGRASRR
ncbi:MAG TPA: hypothetical protein VJ975_06515 [Candidatus Limnocylindria bacterium]|nr:hypothetical protein [Candidatus Limnocylindria bacterium]